MGGFNIMGALKDPVAALDPGGLVYKSSNPDTLAWQAQADIGGLGAAPYLAAQQAANAQQMTGNATVNEQRRQFNAIMGALQPFSQAGLGATEAQQGILGLKGPAEQQSAIAALMQLPQFKSMLSQGENTILQNASASGNLRGGNTQAALAQYRPQVLSSLVNQQLSNLGGLANLGQASALGQGAYGQNAATNIGNIMQQQAASQAGLQMSQANQQAQTLNTAIPIIASFF